MSDDIVSSLFVFLLRSEEIFLREENRWFGFFTGLKPEVVKR